MVDEISGPNNKRSLQPTAGGREEKSEPTKETEEK